MFSIEIDSNLTDLYVLEDPSDDIKLVDTQCRLVGDPPS